MPNFCSKACSCSLRITKLRATTMRSRCCAAQARTGDRGTRQAARSSTPTTASTRPLRDRVRRVRRHARALELYRELLADAPQAADLHLSVAHVLKTQGQQQEAIEAYRSAAACRPITATRTGASPISRPIAFRTTKSSACARPRMRRIRRRSIDTTFASRLARRSRIAASTRSPSPTTSVATRSRKPTAASASNRSNATSGCKRAFARVRLLRVAARGWLAESGAHLHRRTAARRLDAARADSRLALESRGHDGTGRHPAPRAASCRAGKSTNPRRDIRRVLAELGADQISRLGETIPRRHGKYRSGKPFFIDKMPNNFRHIGLIHLILPNAKIIDARREPMACCFSNFKQLFAAGQEFTYGIDDIARYYRTYVQLDGPLELGAARQDPAGSTRRRRRGSRGQRAAAARFLRPRFRAGLSRVSTRPSAASELRAPSRCAGPYPGRGSTSGAISSPGSGP